MAGARRRWRRSGQLLASLAATGARGALPSLEVVTVSSDAERTGPLLRSFPGPVRQLPVQGPWRVLRKFERVLEYLEEDGGGDAAPPGEREPLLLYVDAYDVRWLGGGRGLEEGPPGSEAAAAMTSLEEAIRSLGKPVFFSAEFGLHPWGPAYLSQLRDYPDPQLPECSSSFTAGAPCQPKTYPEPSLRVAGYTVPPSSMRHPESSAYRFVNAGCFGGARSALRRFLRKVLADPSYWESPFEHSKSEAKAWAGNDQLMAHNYYMRHRDEVALDFGADICLSLFGMRPRHFTLDLLSGQLSTVLFRKPLRFVHDNGGRARHPLLDVLTAARERLEVPAEAWKTDGERKVERWHGADVVKASQDSRDTVAAFVDTGQCFLEDGTLDVVSFASVREAFEKLKVQVWRPAEPQQELLPPARFELVAESGPIGTGDPDLLRKRDGDGGMAGKEGAGGIKLISWEFDISRYGLDFQKGDCLGWSVGQGGVFASFEFDPWMDLVTLGSESAADAQVGEVHTFDGALHRHYAVSAYFVPRDLSLSRKDQAEDDFGSGHLTEGGLSRLAAYRAMGFEPQRVLDVGASQGVWTRAARRLFPRSDFHTVEVGRLLPRNAFDLIRMDAHGSEAAIIRRGRQLFRKAELVLLVLQLLPTRAGAEPGFAEVVALMRDLGFHMVDVVDAALEEESAQEPGRTPRMSSARRTAQLDVLFARNTSRFLGG